MFLLSLVIMKWFIHRSWLASWVPDWTIIQNNIIKNILILKTNFRGFWILFLFLIVNTDFKSTLNIWILRSDIICAHITSDDNELVVIKLCSNNKLKKNIFVGRVLLNIKCVYSVVYIVVSGSVTSFWVMGVAGRWLCQWGEWWWVMSFSFSLKYCM